MSTGRRIDTLESLLLASKATPGPTGPAGAAGPAGPPGPITSTQLDTFMMNDDLVLQVDGIVQTFTVSHPFVPGKALVFLGGMQQEHVSFNGPAGTFTLPVAPTTEDLGNGTLRFWGVKA